VGAVILDLETLFQMWRDIKHRQMQSQAADKSRSTEVQEISVDLGDSLEWYKDEHGNIQLRNRKTPSDKE
jgi:hypothetical protein